jgi:hypothetical protein
MSTRAEVYAALDTERNYQDRKYATHRHTPGEWLLIMEKLLADAKKAWYTNCDAPTEQVLHEIRQVTATGVAALEQYGAPPRKAK